MIRYRISPPKVVVAGAVSECSARRPPVIAVSRFSHLQHQRSCLKNTSAASGGDGEPDFSESVQHQRIFFLITSAETGRPFWMLICSICPCPKSRQYRIKACHAG